MKSRCILGVLVALLGAACAKNVKDQVLLQVSNFDTNQALTSVAALRLRERIARDPMLIEKEAADAGIELKPMQRKLLTQLRAAGPSNHTDHLSLLQSAGDIGEVELNNIANVLLDVVQDEENQLKDANTAISNNQKKLTSASRASLINGLSSATTGCITKAINGESIDEGEMLSMFIGIIGTALSFVGSPVAGALFTMTFSIIGGILPGQKKEDPLDKLYKKIMAEVREIVTEKVNQAQFREFQTEAVMVLDELKFVASLLTSTQDAASRFEDQLNLMWLLMIQHDLRLIRYQLSGFSVCSKGRHFSQECRDWHKNCVFILVDDVLHAERGIAVKLLKLEPESGLKVDARIVGEVPELIDVIEDGYLQCMGEVQGGSYYSDAAENASDFYRSVWERLPALMSLSDREEHKAYWEYTNAQNASKRYDIPVEIDIDYECLDHQASEHEWCGRRNGLLQAIYVPRMDMPMWDDDKVLPTRQIV